MLFPPYTGWGSSYNEFPLLYLINAFASWITGIDVLTIMPKLTPIFGGLSVLVFYFLAYELTKNKKIAMLSTLFFAVLPFHVYQTSHASPLTIGHFFMVLSLYLFLRYRQNTKYVFPLLISTMLLIMSHHLTTYFYLISLILIVFVENASVKEWTLTLKKDIFYIIAASLLIFSYWALIAKTVFESFMRSGFSIGGIRLEPILIIIIFYLLFACLFGIIKIIRRFNDYIVRIKPTVKSPISKFCIKIIWPVYPFVKKKWPSTRSRILIFSVVILAVLIAMGYFSIFKMPWTNFSFTIESIIYSLPLLVAIAFGFAGFRYTWHIENGLFIRGWILAIVISFLYALVTNNSIILAHRHPEYLMAPLAIVMVYGLGGIFSDPYSKAMFSKLRNKKDIYVSYVSGKIKIPQKNRLIQLSVIFILVVSLTLSVYVVHRALNVAVEEITTEDVFAIEWISENLDKNTSTIASDHRLARMAEAYGFNTTKDETIVTWTAENLEEYIDELIGVSKNHSRITHIIIDDKMKNDVIHVSRKIFFKMTNETWTTAYDKFSQQPFELIYKNETIDVNPDTQEPIHWAEVYEVNWTYIDNFYLVNIKQ